MNAEPLARSEGVEKPFARQVKDLEDAENPPGADRLKENSIK